MVCFTGKECEGVEGSVDKIDVDDSSTTGIKASHPIFIVMKSWRKKNYEIQT